MVFIRGTGAINSDNGEVLLSQAREFNDVTSYRLAADLTLSKKRHAPARSIRTRCDADQNI